MGPAATGSSRRVRQGQLWESVVENLVERIVSGEFAPGQLLPSEGTLAEEYGVSRLSLRDAIKVLQEKGLVQVQHGVGSVVRDGEEWNALDAVVISARLRHEGTGDEVFDDLSVVRIALESELAFRAAQRADDMQRAALEGHVRLMDQHKNDPDAYLELDVRFHELIVQMAGNRTARALMSSIQEPLRQSRRITNRIPHGVENAHGFHTRIAAAVVASDAEQAARLMREHLTWSWDRYREMRTDADARAARR